MPADHAAVEAALAAAPTRVLYLETISNPTIAVADLPALAALGRRHGATVIVDNTFASPALCRPLEHGADLVVESATKYLSGHSDVLAGVVVGSSGRGSPPIRALHVETGGTLAPFSAFLVLRGIPTLALRMERHAATAARLAAFLETAAGGGARPLPDAPLAPPPRRRGPPPRVRRRDARPGSRRWRGGGPRLRRRPADPGADGVAGQHPHDRRPPAVHHPSPAERGGARGGGDRPRPRCASRWASRTPTTCSPTWPRRSRPRARRRGGRDGPARGEPASVAGDGPARDERARAPG